MGKAKTSAKQKNSSEILPKLKPSARAKLSKFDPTEFLADKRNFKLALMECLREGDVESLKEILLGHYQALDIQDRLEATGLPRRTLFHALSKNGNPTLNVTMRLISGALQSAD